MARGTLYMGVDPGVMGYLALLSTDGWTNFEAFPRKGGKLDLPELCNRVRNWGDRWRDQTLPFDRIVAVLEEVHAMPMQGVVSTFAFGRTFGRIEAALVAARIPLVLVRAHIWKREILTKDERDLKKDGSIIACERLFPAVQLPMLMAGKNMGKVNHNAADALCLAEYGRRKGL